MNHIEEKLPIEVSAFFDSYVECFNKLNPKLIANQYHSVSLIVDATGTNSFCNTESLVLKLTDYCREFKNLGYSDANFKCGYFQYLGEQSCFVDLCWVIELASSNLEYKTAYTLHKLDGEWKIGSAVVYGY